jgi:NAD(P)-dependent dehydrogenase (short-subunit alcohol dehydrogenase family)
MDGRLGEFRPMVDGFADAFPEASRVLGAPSVAGIAALSTVVGMECPGLYSLFASATLAFSDDVETAVRYRAERLFAAVRQVVLRVRAPGIEASLRAGARHPPLAQPGTAQVRSVVEPDEFAGRRALIVGGSRGLGELTARIIAAGAGRPVITYASGAADAASVSDEIRGGGGQCETLRYDALTPAEPQLAALTIVPTSVYYFATGPIFLRKQALYEPELASDFHRLYVDGFYALLSALRARSSAPLAVFYPSSIAVESLARDLAEYAAAKAAGEMLCKHLAAFLPDTRITVSRLPRIATDQTATLVPVHTEDALVTMLPIVREVETPML